MNSVRIQKPIYLTKCDPSKEDYASWYETCDKIKVISDTLNYYYYILYI